MNRKGNKNYQNIALLSESILSKFEVKFFKYTCKKLVEVLNVTQKPT